MSSAEILTASLLLNSIEIFWQTTLGAVVSTTLTVRVAVVAVLPELSSAL